MDTSLFETLLTHTQKEIYRNIFDVTGFMKLALDWLVICAGGTLAKLIAKLEEITVDGLWKECPVGELLLKCCSLFTGGL
jgi:hypothetical protein